MNNEENELRFRAVDLHFNYTVARKC